MFLKAFLTQIYYHMEHNKITSINMQIVNIYAVYYEFIYNKLYYILYTYTYTFFNLMI